VDGCTRRPAATAPLRSTLGLQAAFDADYEAVQQAGAGTDRLDGLIEQMAVTNEYADVARRLWCLEASPH